MSTRWSVEQVESVAPSAAAVSAAQPLASPARWSGTGADGDAVWGACRGSGAEPYDTMIDHRHVGFACSCPSRRVPCKHAIALLLLWARGQVADTAPPPTVAAWVARRSARRSAAGGPPGAGADAGGPSAGRAGDGAPRGPTAPAPGDGDGADDGSAGPGSGDAGDPSEGGAGGPSSGPAEADDRTGAASRGEASVLGDASPEAEPVPPPEPDRDAARDDRVARMHAGLTELDRWLDDRIRTGLADPSLARYSTWDSLAARLVDARAGSLANRIRRLAGLVGASPGWHDDVLAELGLLHLLSQAGRRLGSLPDPLADAVATTVGWQVRQADVLAGVPDTDEWVVAGRSDVREDRIEVRRFWLRGATSGRWALVLSFAAYQQSLDTSLTVGTSLRADVHRYPGPALRALVGRRDGDATGPAAPPATTIEGACDELGAMLVAEPWLDRLPATIRARVAPSASGWALTDATGSMPILSAHPTLGSGVVALLAVTAGEAADITIEWTPHGVVPLAVHLADRSLDIGPRADASFVGAA